MISAVARLVPYMSLYITVHKIALECRTPPIAKVILHHFFVWRRWFHAFLAQNSILLPRYFRLSKSNRPTSADEGSLHTGWARFKFHQRIQLQKFISPYTPRTSLYRNSMLLSLPVGRLMASTIWVFWRRSFKTKPYNRCMSPGRIMGRSLVIASSFSMQI